MAGGFWRRSAALAVAAAVVIGTAVLLDLFARREFVAHLRDQAAYALALAATGGTPYEWRFRTADDLIAGHPFGSGRHRFSDAGLQLDSGDGGLEIGLPLTRPLDLRSFPRLRLAFAAQSGAELRIVVRERLDAPEIVSAPVAFASGNFEPAIDLRAVSWNSDHAPATAAMLRIRFAPGASVLLRGALLQRPADFTTLDLARTPAIAEVGAAFGSGSEVVYRLPFAQARQQADIAAIAAAWRPPRPPLVLLAQRGRVEQQMALRNAVYAALPAAILIPENAYEETFAAAREYAASRLRPTPRGTEWWVVAAFGAILLVARWRPPGNERLRALLEIVLTLAAPMWLVVSGRIDGSTLHAPQTVLIGFGLIYAISLSLHPSWRLNGDAFAWSAAAGIVVVAMLIGLAVHEPAGRGAGAPALSRFPVYLGWALLQQFLICAVCTERWRVVTGNAASAVWLGALSFALLHTPNAALMLATFAGGLCWCAIWLRSRALLPLAVSHAASALALSALLPADILHSAEVSVRFFQ